jgi:hypothetical protein
MLKIGAASKIITEKIDSWAQSAGISKIRDELEISALYIENNGEKLLLVSCDLALVPTDIVVAARKQIRLTTDIPERNIIIAATHTHSSRSVLKLSYLKTIDTAYLERLVIWLTELAKAAVTNAVPGKIGWGRGATKIGYNRRCCWSDGSHTMHGDSNREDFIGLEGPDDPDHTVIAAVDADDNLIAILQNNTTHPTCFYKAGLFSADCPGASRKFLRDIFGPIPVLFFNGAFGDISIEDQCAPKGNDKNRAQKMLRAAHLMTGETLRLLHEMSFCADLKISHKFEDMPIPVRLPEKKRLAWAKNIIKKIDAGEDVKPPLDQMCAWGIIDLDNRFGKDPSDIISIHAIMIGELAIVTQPCELYCSFGLDIKRRSPAAATAIFGLADGFCGYCPTFEGIMGGGYSGEPMSWARLSEQAGYRIIDTASRLLRDIHPEK